MWLWIALSLASFAGLLSPFTDRLYDTSLWAGRALTPPELATASPRGLQEAITAGWPSTLMFIISTLKISAVILGFCHTWWAGFVVYCASGCIVAIAKLTPIASRSLERYLMILLSHAVRRHADYSLKKDAIRAEAARDLIEGLTSLLEFYKGSGVPVPTAKQAKAAPCGDVAFLLTRLRSS